ncbi:metallophosphoesterase [Micromonospora sp. NPDC000089]|uniref:metallophosphoesterase n=1 Tax=unclassified Micromonospora TaxID=2617518 RepID=UPI0036C884B3
MKRRNAVRLAVAAGLVAAAAVSLAQQVPLARADDGGPVAGDHGWHPRPPTPQPPPSPTPSPTPPPGLGAPLQAWAWTQLTPDGTQVRFVTPAPTCPVLVVTTGTNSVRRPMVLASRVTTYPTDATVCTRLVPNEATSAQIDKATSPGVPVGPNVNGFVPLPNWTQPGATTNRPTNIAEIGDTGCRIPPAPFPQQICTNTPTTWPLQTVATNAATSPVPPNLVVHTGDYIYRAQISRQPAPLCGQPGSSPNNSRTWGCLVADFLAPAAALLERAPFVFVRGNHETCGRSGEVWFRYLAPTLSTTACTGANPQDYSAPVQIRAGALTLLLTDTSCAGDDQTPPTCSTANQVAIYRGEFERVNSTLVRPGDNFLLSHVPIWAVVGQTPTLQNPVYIDQDLEAAVTGTTLGTFNPGIKLILSGHVHLYQMLNFAAGSSPVRPAQVTVGDSGTELDQKTWTDSNLIGKDVDGVPLGNLITLQTFGYAVLRDIGTTWNLRFFNQSGNQVAGTSCNLSGTQFVGCV